jgi:hypothetical protein
MCNPPINDRSSSLSLGSVFRLAPLFSRPLVVLSLAVVTLGLPGPGAIAQNIFSCSSGFNNTSGNACGAPSAATEASFGNYPGGYAFEGNVAPLASGAALTLVPVGQGHNGNALTYQTQVNVQAFTTTFTFVPGDNEAFVIQNNTKGPAPAYAFASGAGGEGGFYQNAGGNNIDPNNVFALMFDSEYTTTSGFSYSSVQLYQGYEMPAVPAGTEGLPAYDINKVSTSPVPLNSPASSQGTSTGHTYSATVGYDGWNFNLCLYDVTAGNGSCSSATSGTGTFFTHSWSGVNIPSIVNGTNAYLSMTSGVGEAAANPVLIPSWSYTVNTPTGTPSYTAWNANSTYTVPTTSAASPVYSVAPGTYSGTQSVAITTSRTPSNYICYVLSPTVPTYYPQPDSNGGCVKGTLYTSPVSISSTATLYAMAGSNDSAFPSGSINPSGLGPPSTLVAGTYTIGGIGSAGTPTFSPAAGTYAAAQSVTLSTVTSGAVICYNTTGSPATNGSTGCASGTLYTGPVTVSSSKTLYAVAGGTGYIDSSVGSASYVIQASVATPTFSPVAGTYSSAQSVALSDATSNATIYYTTNGTTPTTSSTQYTGPIAVSSTETLEAIAVATGGANSAVASAAYTISASSSQPTNFAIGTTVQQSPVKHLGINLGGQNYYDSGQISRNLTVRNPGFEAEMWSSILNCQAATATTCTDSDPTNVWPANFLQGATFQVIYGAAKGQTGTITGNTVSNSSANAGITLTFSAPLSPAPGPGDVVQVRMQVPGNPQAGWWVSASGGATFSPDTTDLSPETPGKQALAINAAASGQAATVTSNFDSYNGRSFVQLNGAYTLTFRAKAVSGSNQINVSLVRTGTPTHGNVTYLNQNVSLNNQWQDYSYTFNGAEDGTYVGTTALTFSIQGAQVYLDDVALTEPAAADNPTAFRNAVVDTLKTLQPGVLRFMDGGADFASSTDNMLAVPFARLRAGYGEGQTEQDDISIGLHDFLVLCQTVGAEPWYTVPAGISPADMQNLVQYLAGDASTPYGAIRSSLGQSAPWTAVFPKIHLELGNEMWNSGSFAGEAIANPVAYGGVAATAFAATRASSSYDASKFDLVMGSWAAQPSWTAQELANSSGYDSVDEAPYLFNSLNDYGSNEAIFGPMFAQPEQVDSSPTASGNYMYQQAQAAAAGSTPAKLAVYEVNLSPTSGTAPQNMVNSVAAGLGAGIATADHMLLMMRDLGITTQNMFALPEYVNGFSNSQGGTETVPLWGSVIDMGGETNLKRPQFFALQLANSAILPTMLATTVSGANPTWNQPLSTNDSIQLANAHYLQSFAFINGTQNSVVVFNLSRDGSLPVTFSGVNAPSGNVLISQLTSTNPADSNEGLFTSTPVVAGPTLTNVGNFNPATPYSLPPYSMTVFSTGGAALLASTITLQASPTSANAGQSVTLTATVTSQSGTNTPTGTVTFLDGATSLGKTTLNASGVATFSTSSLSAGTQSMTASYGGDNNYNGSVSNAVSVVVSQTAVATTTRLTASATQITIGQSVTFTAKVVPQSGKVVPAGSIKFFDGTKSLGRFSLNAGGTTALSTSALAAGTHSITASYFGDVEDSSSVSNAISVVVMQSTVATTTTPTASAAQITSGLRVTFTAEAPDRVNLK